jgi:thiol-disulfide isomerase/thioredoxin
MLLKGEDIALRSKEGINMALLFWATWCSHSRNVVEEFEDLAREYKYRGDLEFYGISVDKNEDINLLKGRIRSQSLKTMVHVFSGNDTQDEAFLALKGSNVPYVVFVDTRGVVRYVDYSVGGLREFLSQTLGSRQSLRGGEESLPR